MSKKLNFGLVLMAAFFVLGGIAAAETTTVTTNVAADCELMIKDADGAIAWQIPSVGAHTYSGVAPDNPDLNIKSNWNCQVTADENPGTGAEDGKMSGTAGTLTNSMAVTCDTTAPGGPITGHFVDLNPGGILFSFAVATSGPTGASGIDTNIEYKQTTTWADKSGSDYSIVILYTATSTP